MVWCLTDTVFEKDIKGPSGSFIFPSWNWFNAYSHAHPHIHTHTAIHPPTYPHTQVKKRRERKTTAPSSVEPRQINAHLLLSPLAPPPVPPHLFPPSSFASMSPHQRWHSIERKLFTLFSLCEWPRPITSLFNEHVVFPCTAYSPNTPFQHWQLSGKGMVCVREREKEVQRGRERERDIVAV